jgi:hypothetical protein
MVVPQTLRRRLKHVAGKLYELPMLLTNDFEEIKELVKEDC